MSSKPPPVRWVCPRCPNAITLRVQPRYAPWCWNHPRGQQMQPEETQ